MSVFPGAKNAPAAKLRGRSHFSLISVDDASCADIVARVVAVGEVRDLDDVAGVGRVDELVAADVDAAVANVAAVDRGEEQHIAGTQGADRGAVVGQAGRRAVDAVAEVAVAVVDEPGAVKTGGGGPAVDIGHAEEFLRVVHDVLTGAAGDGRVVRPAAAGARLAAAGRGGTGGGRLIAVRDLVRGGLLSLQTLLFFKLGLHVCDLAGDRSGQRVHGLELGGVVGGAGLQGRKDALDLFLLGEQVRLFVLVFLEDLLLRSHFGLHGGLRVLYFFRGVSDLVDEVGVVLHDLLDVADAAEEVLKIARAKDDGYVRGVSVFLHRAEALAVLREEFVFLLLVDVELIFKLCDRVCIGGDLLGEIFELLIGHVELLGEDAELLVLVGDLSLERLRLGLNGGFLFRKLRLLIFQRVDLRARDRLGRGPAEERKTHIEGKRKRQNQRKPAFFRAR